MVDLKAVLNVVPTMQSAYLVSEGVHSLSKRRKKRPGLLEYGTKVIIGTAIIKTESDLIGGI